MDILSRENRVTAIQFCLNHVRRESFMQAVEYVQLSLMTDQPNVVRTINYVLDPYKNVETIDEQLREIGIQTDGSDWINGVKKWKNLAMKDLYKRLSKKAKEKWNTFPELKEMKNAN